MAAKSQWIVEPTMESFEADVVIRSNDVPVVVDFWAPWCEPCRQLAPLLEKLVEEYDGKFILAKVNIDETPQIASAFGVQSIPVVFAVSNGQPINEFVGILPEDQLREWIKTILPSPVEELMKQAAAIEAENPEKAEQNYRDAMELVPDNDAIKIHLARVLLVRNRAEECRQVIEKLEERGYLEPEAETIKSQLDLLSGAEEAGGLDEARKSAEANPDDLSLQIKFADVLAVSRKHEEALELCLSLIERDKAGIGNEAKETMVKIFDMLGASSELVSTYRRKLATAWY